jgi:DNA-directed RNA polymerase specialized sigma24 family protein
VLGTHYHLVVQLTEPNLSQGMQALNGRYGREFNERYAHEGHVFQRRFWSKPVRTEAHLFGLARYVALNPVRANLCAIAAGWPWSAHRSLTRRAPPGFVDVAAMLSHFHEDPVRAGRMYAAMVEQEEPGTTQRVDARLAEILAFRDRREAIAHAARLGYGAEQIAATLGCGLRTVHSALAKGV